jgi:hypothetical protein
MYPHMFLLEIHTRLRKVESINLVRRVYDIQREVGLVSGRRGRRREGGEEPGEWERLEREREEEEMRAPWGRTLFLSFCS